MGKIRVITKERGQGVYLCSESTWEYLNKLIISDLIENSENIIIKNENKEFKDSEIIIDKKRIYANTPEFITYTVNLNYGGFFPGGGLQILLNKHKNDQTKFDLRGFYPESYKISFQVDSGYIDESLNDHSFNPSFTKKIYLNGQELSLFFQALSKNLFAVPKKGYLLFESTPSEGGGYLYFDTDYYEEFKDSVVQKYNDGKFSESNAEYEWNQLKNTIEIPYEISNPDISSFEIYLVSK